MRLPGTRVRSGSSGFDAGTHDSTGFTTIVCKCTTIGAVAIAAQQAAGSAGLSPAAQLLYVGRTSMVGSSSDADNQGKRSPRHQLHAYFETEMFCSELHDRDIDQVVLGGDCAKWFRSRLAPDRDTGEPIQEDWGWVLPVTVAGQGLWFMIQKWHTTDRGWHVWIEPRGLLSRIFGSRFGAAAVRLRDTADRLLTNEPRVNALRWVGEAGDLE